MTDKRTVDQAANIDETFLAAHPKLAVLALDLPDSDGEPWRASTNDCAETSLRDRTINIVVPLF